MCARLAIYTLHVHYDTFAGKMLFFAIIKCILSCIAIIIKSRVLYDSSREQQFKSPSAVKFSNIFKTWFYSLGITYIGCLFFILGFRLACQMLHSRQSRNHETESSECHYSGKMVYIYHLYNTLVRHLTLTQSHFSISLAAILKYSCQHIEIINRNIFDGAYIGSLYDLWGYYRPLSQINSGIFYYLWIS